MPAQTGRHLSYWLSLLCLSSAASFAHANEASPPPHAAPDPTKLRICASANQQPYSAKDGSGFENKIGTIVAEAMARQPDFVFSDKPAIYTVRDMLNKNLCDVVVGLDSGDQRVLTTRPYYRANYVFVTQKAKHFNFTSWNDPAIKSLGPIVVDFGSPSEVMLKEVGKYNENMAYLYSLVGFRAPRNEYVQISPQRMVGEVTKGDADLAVAFAPDIARYVKADQALQMVPVKDDAVHNGDEKLPQQYDQSMGVRLGDTQLQDALNAALDKAHDKIQAILTDEGIVPVHMSN